MLNSVRETTIEENTHLDLDVIQETLRERIRVAAKAAPRFPDFIEQLSQQHITLICKLTRKGRVSSIHYAFQTESQIKASALGEAFTWTGLQRKLGVEYVQIRDFKLLSSLAQTATPTSAKSKTARSSVHDNELLQRLEQLETLEKQILVKLDNQQAVDLEEMARKIEALSADELQRVDDAIVRLEELANVIHTNEHNEVQGVQADAVPEGADEELRHTLTQIRGLCQRALSDTNKSLHRVELAANKMRQESFWLAFVSALIAAFVAALLTGLWMTQEMEKTMESNRQSMIQELEQKAEDDPFRAYFQKLMDDMP